MPDCDGAEIKIVRAHAKLSLPLSFHQRKRRTEVRRLYRWAFKPLLPTVPTIGIPDTIHILQNKSQGSKQLWRQSIAWVWTWGRLR
jgi:hypothetical protein